MAWMRTSAAASCSGSASRASAYSASRSSLRAMVSPATKSMTKAEPRPSLWSAHQRTRPEPGTTPAAAELARFEGILRAIAPDPHPAFELALRWLAAGLPPSPRQTVVHGDYRVGNVIVGPEGLRAVIDWELTHVGDPMEDVGWLCVRSWRFGAPLPVGGLCERERFFAAYERAGGAPVDPAVVCWWEVFGNLRWGIMTLMQAQTFLGGVRNVELASLGRRTCEMELELLDLMDGGA